MMSRMAGGAASLLKEGTKLTEKDEAIVRNILACRELTEKVRTSMGPLGMNKMVIDKHDKIYITSDTASIVKELEIEHPAAKILVMAAERQEEEVGDGTNFVISFGGELLLGAQNLLDLGLHASDIVKGYEKAGKQTLAILDEITNAVANSPSCKNMRSIADVRWAIHTVITTKQFGYVDILSDLIAQACVAVCPQNPTQFNVDHVRSVKVLGGGVMDSEVISGFALHGQAVGTIRHVKSAKVAVFAGGLDLSKTEGKGTVNITTADQLENYSKGEEQEMETLIKGIAEAGANVVVSSQTLSDITLHYVEKYKLMALVVQSKFNLRRICVATKATPLVRIGKPLPEELGDCETVDVTEMGSAQVTFFRTNPKDTHISTIIIRGATPNILDDVERAIDDGVNVYKVLAKDPRAVPGAGAVEIELARRLRVEGEKLPGLEQYSFQKYAEALEVIPRTLSETAGMDEIEALSTLHALHEAHDKRDFGVDVENQAFESAHKLGVWDLALSKRWAIKLATDSVTNILRVDQIIMAKPAGGPKIPKGQSQFDAD